MKNPENSISNILFKELDISSNFSKVVCAGILRFADASYGSKCINSSDRANNRSINLELP